MAVLPVSLTLLEAARQGDAGAFEVLLRPLLEPGYRLAGGMLQDPEAAQDAVQEAAFKAWKHLRQLREGSDLRPWFLGIVANECRTVRRSRWSRVVRSEHFAPVQAAVADPVLTRIQIRDALRALEEKKRLALVLRWYLDLPVDVIAAITKSSVHAVEGRLQRGMNELRSKVRERS